MEVEAFLATRMSTKNHMCILKQGNGLEPVGILWLWFPSAGPPGLVGRQPLSFRDLLIEPSGCGSLTFHRRLNEFHEVALQYVYVLCWEEACCAAVPLLSESCPSRCPMATWWQS